MFLVVGLGNPGSEYASTRHNVGFMAADEIHSRYNFSAFKNKFDGAIAEGVIDSEKVYLLKPQTFMNLSGNSVIKAAHFYKIMPENIVVIHDDMDLPLGKIKAKRGGGSGGHNGIKSIDAAVTPDYNRIRIGVGHPQESGKAVINHVLSAFGKKDRETIDSAIEVVATTIGVLIKKGIDAYSGQLGMIQKNKEF